MEKTFRHIIALAATALLTFTACTDDNEPAQLAADTQQLTFTITDSSGYASAEADTRAEENGYATVFTDGDTCGLYIVRGTEIAYSNIKLTASADDSGNLTWSAPTGTTLAGGMTGEQYYLYYPYQSDTYMSGKTATTTSSGMSDADFFKQLISSWQPQTNQSTYSKYTSSDLMTARGTVSTTSGGTNNVSFTTVHRMALAVIDLPKTTYHFTNTTGGTVPDYTLTTATYTTYEPLLADDGTHRYIVNPSSSATDHIVGAYANGTKEFTIQKTDLKNIGSGSYRKFVVDGGNATTITQDYNIQIGDFLMRDGSLLPKGSTLTTEQKANVAAIVFWTPAETNLTDATRKTPAKLSDDKIMAADYPDCTHGLAVALKDIGKMRWQENMENIADFQSGDNFTHSMKSDFKSIASDEKNTSPFNYILGYQNTQILKAYNAYCKANGKADYVMLPVDKLDDFTTSNPAPAGSTGWFIPSVKELRTLCYKDVDYSDISYESGISNTETRNIVEKSLSATGGESIVKDRFYSSTETNGYIRSYSVQFKELSGVNEDYSASYAYSAKGAMIYVRAVCAF